MNKTELLITPAEAIRLSHTRTISDFDIVKELTAEFEKDLTAEDVEENQWFYSMCLLSAIWNAGRLWAECPSVATSPSCGSSMSRERKRLGNWDLRIEN